MYAQLDEEVDIIYKNVLKCDMDKYESFTRINIKQA